MNQPKVCKQWLRKVIVCTMFAIVSYGTMFGPLIFK